MTRPATSRASSSAPTRRASRPSSRRIERLSVAEVALSDPSGKIVVTLETRDEDEIVAAMAALQRMTGVVSVALVYHQTEA